MRPETRGDAGDSLVRVRGLSRKFGRRPWGARAAAIQALDGVDLDIAAGTTLALVGESGSGKSTLAACLACLERPDAGAIWFDGRDLAALSTKEILPLRRRIQLVFQDSASALNPRFTAAESIEEPMKIQRTGTARLRRARALELMEQVGLSVRWSERRPMELSGGQRQRVAIARALSLEPELLILDECLAGLDLSVQAQIVNLLLDIKERRGLTYLFVSHDLALLSEVADEVAVMLRGRIVERGAAAQVFASPRHPLTRSLLASILDFRRPA